MRAGVLAGEGGGRGTRVAVKAPAIRTSADLASFRAEVALLARGGGGRVTRLAGARLLPPHYWAATPLAAGGSLAGALEGGAIRPGAWDAAARLGADVAAGLARLHGAGIAHRDVKPGNVFLSRGRTRAWLGDLGVGADLWEGGGGGEGGVDRKGDPLGRVRKRTGLAGAREHFPINCDMVRRVQGALKQFEG